ncbi:MAG: tRNA 2-selenouridine(34) synthase MnmH [Saprospiraceae bacterium]|jgi:tRNA 2-selenouridine synthase|nr:tRNA 2-selenouridine(34) synthase MnmH [Saprospiraceae bacterium]MBK6480136.1 tRNA 2-selenouridine(34) synthase MnmH [Saprospiraceae bacterium]MBK6815008.1 tRNA 2-selenouridine(34) synthase MnmH [Saprospiraceae bacterium]MBK7435491.1 tRNA 2-selenouridine(34) synthase MnmH [Saprospiraceae bacterium]MBK7607538.1 tRNA 2-selenouridine(34) synthase MnmH [Saprospiraceae bacterium]
MHHSTSIEEWLQATDLPILDVRSPSEYAHGHVPGAHSIPLFDDEGRALVGTTYKQAGKSEALIQGLELAGPKLADIVKAALAIAPLKKVRLHCWRGGMRSGSVAWLLHTMGFEQVLTLTGGYKVYRNWVLAQFEKKYELYILGGRTGSAKTDVLKQLAAHQLPVIDLEGLAHHKGSAFGWIGEQAQPTQEQFENNLAQNLHPQASASIWMEDESERIGMVRIPNTVYEQIRSAPVFFLDIPITVRIPHLVKTYSHFGDEKLETSILRISKRLGGLNTKLALDALKIKDYTEVARITLGYYDKYYEAGVGRRVPSSVHKLPTETIDPAFNADLILKHKSDLLYGIHQTHAV